MEWRTNERLRDNADGLEYSNSLLLVIALAIQDVEQVEGARRMTPAQILGNGFSALHRLAQSGQSVTTKSNAQLYGEALLSGLQGAGFTVVSHGYVAGLEKRIKELGGNRMRVPGPHNCYEPHPMGEMPRHGYDVPHPPCPGGRPPTVPEMVAWLRAEGAIDYEAAQRKAESYGYEAGKFETMPERTAAVVDAALGDSE